MENFPHRPSAPAVPASILARGKFLKYAQGAFGRPWVRSLYRKLPYVGPALTAAQLGMGAWGALQRYYKGGKRKGGRGPLPPSKRRRTGPAPGRGSRGGPITTQQDYKVSRGKKRLSKKQKSWKKFVKKVHSATEQNDKTHFLVEAHDTDLGVAGTLGIQQQQMAVTSAAIGDLNLQLSPVGNIATGPGKFVTNLVQQKDVTTVAGGTVGTVTAFKDLRYKLLGASCTLSWKNDMAYNMYADVYECLAASDITDSTFSTARAAFINCLNLNGQLDQTGGYAKLTTTQSGCTPYQAPGFGKYWKIIKKTRVLCTPGSVTNYTYFTRPKVIHNAVVTGQYATKGLTKDIIFIANPTYNGATTVATVFRLEWSKCYALKVYEMPGLQAQWAYQSVD